MCVCVETRGGQRSNQVLFLRSHSPRLLRDDLSLIPVYCDCLAGLPVSPKDLCLCLPSAGLKMCTTILTFLTWVLGVDLKTSRLHRKYFTN